MLRETPAVPSESNAPALVWKRFQTLALAFAACMIACCAAAHDIPFDVKIDAFLKPEGNRLELLVRVPLSAMSDVEFPTRGPGFLDIANADEALHNGARQWLIDNIDVFENGMRLPAPQIAQARVSLPSDLSFRSYDAALAHLNAPRLRDDLDLYWNQQLVDVLLEYPIGSDRSVFSIAMRVERFGALVSTALRFLSPGAGERVFEFHGNPGLLHLDPSRQQTVSRFVQEGFWEMVGGTDRLLLLACLLIPFRGLRPAIVTIAAFSIGRSVALVASSAGFVPDTLWFPPLVASLLATALFFIALENIAGAKIGARWIYAFGAGLLLGFDFAFVLREQIQFAGPHLLTALASFDLGIEIAEVAALLVVVVALNLLFRYVVAERMGIIILSAIVAHTGWHWMIERWAIVWKFPLPKFDAALVASLMRGAMSALILAAIVWLASGLVRRLLRLKDIPVLSGQAPAEGRS